MALRLGQHVGRELLLAAAEQRRADVEAVGEPGERVVDGAGLMFAVNQRYYTSHIANRIGTRSADLHQTSSGRTGRQAALSHDWT